MSHSDDTHDQQAVQETIRFARGAKPKQRRPFAVGEHNGLPVIVVLKSGKPHSARKKLRDMEFAPGSKLAKGAGGIRINCHGLLHKNSEAQWILECDQKPNIEKLKKTQKYFREFKKPSPFRFIILRPLAADDEGDIYIEEAGSVPQAEEADVVPAGGDQDEIIVLDEFPDAEGEAPQPFLATSPFGDLNGAPEPPALPEMPPIPGPTVEQAVEDLKDTIAALIERQGSTLDDGQLQKLFAQQMKRSDHDAASALLQLEGLLLGKQDDPDWLSRLVGVPVGVSSPFASLQTQWHKARMEILMDTMLYQEATDTFLEENQLPELHAGGGTWSVLDALYAAISSWSFEPGNTGEALPAAVSALDTQLAFLESNSAVIRDLDIHDYSIPKGRFAAFGATLSEIKASLETAVNSRLKGQQPQSHSQEGR